MCVGGEGGGERVRARARESVSRFLPLSTGWLQEIGCEQTITCSIWPGRRMRAVGGKHTFMYRVVCQLDGARGGSCVCACQQILFFFPPSRSTGSSISGD